MPPTNSWRNDLRYVTAALLGSVFAAILLVILAIWLRSGGISNVHGSADMLTSLGRLSGLLASYSLMLQLLLMSRLPFVEYAFGWTRTSAWHKLNGKVCLYLVLAHVALVIVGYAIASKLSVTTEAVQMVQGLYGMPAAVIGTAIMFVVVATSFAIVRSRLRYEWWYLVHLSIYAAVFLAWFHQIPTSTIFVNNALAVAFWTALYVGTLEFLVLFRVVQPIVRTLWHDIRVEAIVDEGAGVTSVRMSGRHLLSFNAEPGQFFIWRFLAPGFWQEAHPFSISSTPTDTSIRLTAKGIGDFSSRLPRLPKGTRVIAEGPFGHFTPSARSRKDVVMIAGGIGITPIRAMLERITGNITVIYRVIRPEEEHLRNELDQIAVERGITIHYIVGDHRKPQNRNLLSEQHLLSLVPNITVSDVYVCGPPPLMRLVETNLARLGVRKAHIHTDTFCL